jgi:diguanylate cyclase (GGDEF)-like protein
MTVAATARGDLVPLDERLRYLRVLRLLMSAAVAFFALMMRGSLADAAGLVWLGTGCYLAASLAAEGVWRLAGRRGPWILGPLLILDGLFLAWANYETGMTTSPVRYLILMQLVAVALLGSYRSALKLAGWQSVLAFVVFYARQAGLLSGISGGAGGARLAYRGIVEFVVAFWLLTLLTGALTAVNERELRRRRVDLEALAVMGQDLQEVGSLAEISRVLVEALAATFSFRRLAIFDAPERGYRLLACSGIRDAVVGDLHLRGDSELVTAGVRRRTTLLARLDPDRDPWLSRVLPDAVNLLVVPLIAEGRAVAVLVAESGLRSGSRIERRVVATTERFAAHAALALRNAVLRERMQEMAATDALTSLANRRSLDEALARDLARAEREGGRLSLVLLDLDHFKALNDTYGHLVGDNVLRSVASTLRELGREYDTVARYGGEEFAVVLPNCSPGVARHVAERLRAAVEATATEVPVTASAGVATFPLHAKDLRGLIQAADEALYASKHAGRNRVTAAGQVHSLAAS